MPGRKKIRYPLILFFFSAMILFSGCYGGFKVKAVPAHTFLANRALYETVEEKVKAETLSEIKKLTLVTENSVFTEKRGYPEYIVGAGDVLIINFWEGPNPKPYETTVRPDGKISYAFADNVPVAGHTTSEISAILTQEMKKYIRTPRIEVTVKDYKSKSVLLSGQINNLQQGVSGPGKYNLKGKTTALDLIIFAGGPIIGRSAAARGTSAATTAGGVSTGDADMRKVEVVRNGKKYTINLQVAMFKGDMSQNIIVDDGDIITVPELPIYGERIYVFGEVNQEGIYRLKDAPDFLSALSNAYGLTRIAIKEDIRIIRGYKERNRKPLVISINYWQIMKKADIAQNILLQDGDVIYVPRTVIGDVNEFITNTTPLLDYLFYPSRYRDSYMNTNWMRMNNF